MQERPFTNIHDALGNGEGGKTSTPGEGTIANIGDTLGDGDGGKVGAIAEGPVVDNGHIAGDNGFLTSLNQLIAGREDDGITIIARVVTLIPLLHLD